MNGDVSDTKRQTSLLFCLWFRTEVVCQSEKPLHQVVLDVMEGYTLWGAMFRTLFDVVRIGSIPVRFRISGQLIAVVMPRFEWHVPFPTFVILGIVGNNIELFQEFRAHGIFRKWCERR